jgi:hypothetical protein
VWLQRDAPFLPLMEKHLRLMQRLQGFYHASETIHTHLLLQLLRQERVCPPYQANFPLFLPYAHLILLAALDAQVQGVARL